MYCLSLFRVRALRLIASLVCSSCRDLAIIGQLEQAAQEDYFDEDDENFSKDFVRGSDGDHRRESDREADSGCSSSYSFNGALNACTLSTVPHQEVSPKPTRPKRPSDTIATMHTTQSQCVAQFSTVR